ncbi:cation transporter [Clostridium sp. DJ247]|nr:cation transporter [Clostridium sp. DJ247]
MNIFETLVKNNSTSITSYSLSIDKKEEFHLNAKVKVAKQEDSIALEADALHLKVDIYTSLGVGSGLLLIWITGLTFLDPIVAIVVALFILKEAHDICDNIENELESSLRNTHVMIHIESCTRECNLEGCNNRQFYKNN